MNTVMGLHTMCSVLHMKERHISRLAALDCMCVCVFPDCREATKDGLRHLGSLTYVERMHLYGLPDVMLTDSFLESLHGCSQLGNLHIGGWQSQIKGSITAEAVKRSVSLHIHTGNSISPP